MLKFENAGLQIESPGRGTLCRKKIMSNQNAKIQGDFKDIQGTESRKRQSDPAFDPDGHSQLPNN